MGNDFFNKSVSKKNSFLAKKIVNYNNLSFFVRIIKHLQFVWNIVLLAEVIYFKLISRLTKCHGFMEVIFAKMEQRRARVRVASLSCSVPF